MIRTSTPLRRWNRPGRVWPYALIALAGLLLGAALGAVLAAAGLISLAGLVSPSAPGPAAASQPAPGTAEKQLYTCGMHPNVIQEGPGECPICHMKLTPLKQDTGGGQAAAGGPQERRILYWRAPMDPNYISDKPGKSPMGMDLVPVYADESAAGNTITIDPVTVQNMGIRTGRVERRPLVKTIRTLGRVDYDEQTVTFLDTKFEGWIEKLYVDETGVQVEKGQPLFDVYSPKLYAAQEEYLAALDGVARLADTTLPEALEQARRLVEAAEVQLRYFDVSQEQIDTLRRTRQIRKTLTIHAPAAGIVTEKMALEGMYVRPGMRLFTIADLSRVWVLVDIYEYQLPWVHIGQRAVMSLPYIPGREFTGQVVYIYPYLDRQTRVVKVRLEFNNPTLELKPDMYANVTLEADLGREGLVIPREAFIDSGTRQVAFVALGNGKFQPREIQVGVELGDHLVEVLAGLDEGERIVTSGQFMLDAESKLREAVAKMLAAQTASEPAPAPASQPAAETAPAIPPDAHYACPMETHPDAKDPAQRGPYFSSEPGRCPVCGMHLKPLEELDWVQARLAAGDKEVAYSCPDHPRVLGEHPGTCPRCGHELEPFQVMYTCPDPDHADVIEPHAGTCPHCGRMLAPFRSIWLSPDMAAANLPPHPERAEQAAYRCPQHPLVHSDAPGRCPLCAAELAPAEALPTQPGEARPPIPADAKFVCPMETCWYFSAEPGECPHCGMNLVPIEEVDWAVQARAAATSAAARFLCPMHPQITAPARGTCSICGMQLVPAEAVPRPTSAPAAIAVQMDFLMEHYAEIHRRLAADRTADIPLHALGLVGAADELLAHLDDPDVDLPPDFADHARRLRAAALKLSGADLTADRVVFAELSAAMRALVGRVRPDRDRYPEIYVFHCPMAKADWLQLSDQTANPYYGFKMLDCGTLEEVK